MAETIIHAIEETQRREAYREKLRSLALRPAHAGPKVTRDVTDVGYVDVTEHAGLVRDSDGSGQPGELVERRDVQVHMKALDGGPHPATAVTFPGSTGGTE